MVSQDVVLKLLERIEHPESDGNLVSLGMIEHLQITPDKITLTLVFQRQRDPFAQALKKKAILAIESALPQYQEKVTVFTKEGNPAAQGEKKKVTQAPTHAIKNIVAISSAKGGVGKSTITANLAVALARMNYRVGILDADIYGPSQHIMFGLEEYQPQGHEVQGAERMIPAQSWGVKVMSIGFFIDPNDALIWRGPMATNALKQMIHQTDWGELDFLLIDFPPGTGDVHLTLINELKINGAVLVSTPQKVALGDVVRGLSMFRAEKINIPIVGMVENMAWFTPAELPDHRYYIFGQGGAAQLAQKEGIKLLGQIPLIQNVREAGDCGRPLGVEKSDSADFYEDLAGNMIHQLNKIYD